MINPTDANGRQRTPTGATRPLRETVAEAMGDAIHHYFIPDDGKEDGAVMLWKSWQGTIADAAFGDQQT